ncbi:MAG: aldo/keto reductase [Cucumibacter sp.]
MQKINMPGLKRPVAQLALGTVGMETDAHADQMYDAYVEAGGDIFDTAWLYRKGEAEALFGGWMKRRGVRNELTLIGKGAHTPNCNPAAVHEQLTQSLDRLGTDKIDVYVMHRDNIDVPVAEFVDAMLAEAHAGRIGEYGFSNWTLQRVEEAIAYVLDRGVKLPTALSYNFSLAELVQPVWKGVLAANGPDWGKLLAGGEVGLYSWSAQARGFFTDRADTAQSADPELVRCWFSERNLERRRRAYELGAKRGVSANRIALAWTLRQSFPLVALIGPLTPGELQDSLGAASVDLSPDDVKWLQAE